MPANKHGCDLNEIMHNAHQQGINFREISVFYEGLTEIEKQTLVAQDLLKVDNGDTIIASFTDRGEVLFSEKVKGVHYLAA